MTKPTEKNHTPATVGILVGLLLLVIALGAALALGSWSVASLAGLGFVAWIIGTLIMDVMLNRNRT